MEHTHGAAVSAVAYDLVQDALLPSHERIRIILESLPVLGKESVDLEEPCPICLMPFETVFAEDAAGVEEEKEAQMGGVTKLVGCGHVFCRRDGYGVMQHGSCPTCRYTFLNIRPPSDSDDESSDGGEYIPNADDFEDEDDDGFLDVDGFTDADADDFPVEGMDLDFDELWEDENPLQAALEADAAVMEDAEMEMDEEYEETEGDRSSEWGLTDGESESMSSSASEGGMNMEGNEASGGGGALETEVSVSVHEDEDINGEEDEGLNANDLVSQDPK